MGEEEEVAVEQIGLQSLPMQEQGAQVAAVEEEEVQVQPQALAQ